MFLYPKFLSAIRKIRCLKAISIFQDQQPPILQPQQQPSNVRYRYTYHQTQPVHQQQQRHHSQQQQV